MYSKEIDIKWQNKWKETEIYKFDESQIDKKYYLLEQFAYPSAKNLHIGHWWIYGLSDSFARFKRMQGYQVFHPVGFDAFGLPAENFAIKTGIHPSDSTEESVATMKKQFQAMGTTYDWSYEVVTCREDYYKWTQWLFLKFYEKGLAYRKEAPVNWCTSCLTVLANEQVIDDICERCDSKVIQRNMTQWFFKITDYAEELLTSLDGLNWPESTKTIQRNWIGKNDEGYRLHDWLVSRQRYWGTPIPIIYCDDCGIVPEKDLPVKLPYDVQFQPTGKSPLAVCEDFINTVCPTCGKSAKRETDTLDTFVCSSWYFLRYFDSKNADAPFGIDRVKRIMPVDMYVGGVEHATMHLLYARFFTKVLRDMGYLDFDEPFPTIFHQGVITGQDGKKISKRDGAISPDEYINQHGSDVFRMYLCFGFSYADGGPWDENGIKAISRFVFRLNRVIENFGTDNAEYKPDTELEYVHNYTIKQVFNDLGAFRFNSAIARIMEFVNAIESYQKSPARNRAYEEVFIKDLILLIAPLAPHLSEEFWEAMGYTYSVHQQRFPTYDEAKLARDLVNIAVQVNGKLREVMSLPADATEKEIEKAVLECGTIKQYTNGREIIKVIHVKGKLVNIVCR